MNCSFCDLVSATELITVAHDGERVLAFMDLFPINSGHVLVIPKAHFSRFYEIDVATYTEVMLVVHRIAAALQNLYQPKAVGMLAAGFDVSHAHVHVIPMHDYHDITSRAILEGTRGNPSLSELAEHAERIRTAT